jgi:DNA polymerase V
MKATNITLPLYGSSVSCGFTSPAEDHVENQLSLDDYLVSNPESTFFVRASGDSMIGAGIFDGDLLIIDRSIEVKNNAIVLAILDTEFTVKRFIKTGDSITLRAENDAYDDIQVRGNQTMMVWGVVAHVIHHLK